MTLTSGNYYFNSFTAEDSLHLTLDLTAGSPIRIYVVGDVYTGSGLVTELNGGSPHDVLVQVGGDWDSLADTEGTFFGTIYAPQGGVFVSSNFVMTGAVYGDSVFIQDGFVLTPDPYVFPAEAVPAPAQRPWAPSDWAWSAGSDGDVLHGDPVAALEAAAIPRVLGLIRPSSITASPEFSTQEECRWG